MSKEDENRAGLVPSQSVAVARAEGTSLVRRGVQDLLARAEAEEWYKRGLSLWGPDWMRPIDADSAAGRKAREQATDCFRRGLQLDPNHAALQFYFGLAYSWDVEPGGDYSEALVWWRRAAEQGYADAQYVLGCECLGRQGVPKVVDEGLDWLRKAGDQGEVHAATTLAFMYEYGDDVPQSYAQAVEWYRKAAERADGYAQYRLGYMYLEGRGVQQDDTQAIFWFRQAAEQGPDATGVDDAQYRLAKAYEEGRGVPQDFAQATAWFRRAIEQGHKPARQALDDMLGKAKDIER